MSVEKVGGFDDRSSSRSVFYQLLTSLLGYIPLVTGCKRERTDVNEEYATIRPPSNIAQTNNFSRVTL